MEYHSFLFKTDTVIDLLSGLVSVSLRSYIHSYDKFFFDKCDVYKFPSPYGVIFILTLTHYNILLLTCQFPSPYGVSFILIYNNNCDYSQGGPQVSVSLWSIIHSYTMVRVQCMMPFGLFPSPYGVLFILILPIISKHNHNKMSFRLLTGLYSFLLLK